METIHTFTNPVEHGIPTTFCVDRRHHWLLVGTTHGILDLWDLRFKLRLRSFGIGGAGNGRRIERVLLHPSKGHGRWVIVSCGGEISVWDIEKLVCREVLRPSTFQSPQQPQGSGKGYEAWSPDEQAPEKLLERFAKDIQVDRTKLDPELRSPDTPTTSGPSSGLTPNTTESLPVSIPALATLTDYLANPSQPSNPNKSTILFTAGADRTIRYWDLAHIDQSFIMSGPLVNTVGEDAKDKPKIRYESSWPTSMSIGGLVQLVEEKVGIRGDVPTDASTPRKNRDRRSQVTTATTTNSSGGSTTTTTSTTSSNKAPRNSIISAAQQQLLKTHMDGLMDLIVLKKPYGCVVSVDRIGNVMVFH